jgi:hypothetical protein
LLPAQFLSDFPKLGDNNFIATDVPWSEEYLRDSIDRWKYSLGVQFEGGFANLAEELFPTTQQTGLLLLGSPRGNFMAQIRKVNAQATDNR